MRYLIGRTGAALVGRHSCGRLCKAFFNRTQGWADLEQMAELGTLDVHRLVGALVRYVSGNDARIERSCRSRLRPRCLTGQPQ
jgi:hypothetical protein